MKVLSPPIWLKLPQEKLQQNGLKQRQTSKFSCANGFVPAYSILRKHVFPTCLWGQRPRE